jgi:integrase
MKLDARTVAALSLGGKSDLIAFDDQLPGFGYRLRRATGGKVLRSWIVQYRHGRSTRRMTLGSAEVLTPWQARDKATKLLAEVKLGGDPQGDRSHRRDRNAVTFRAVVTDYLAAKDVRPPTKRYLTAYLTGAYVNALHGMPIDQVTRRDVAAQLLHIARRYSKTTAAATRSALGAFFVWCLQTGLIESNPVVGTPPPAQVAPRDRVLSNPELAAVWNAASDSGLGDFGKIIRLLILTGARRQEIGGMRWSELDDNAGTWIIPAVRSKNGKAHALPLPQAAWDIIKGVPLRVGRDQLFGEKSGGGFCSWHIFKKPLDAKSGTTGWVIHDLRRTVATRLADIGVQPHIIEQILNHQSGHKRGPAGIYNRSTYEREVRATLALWADHVRALVAGEERKVLLLAPVSAK